MSSKNKIKGFYNYFLVTDLMGPHIVLFKSEQNCTLNVDFDKLKQDDIKDTLKFVDKSIQKDCNIYLNDFRMLSIDKLIEYNQNHTLNNIPLLLKIINYTNITMNLNFFQTNFSDFSKNILLNVLFFILLFILFS